ncbi:hypothetical protein F2Q69_00017754 [Brassica cretica]|uniref:HSF-type DNA-binding domain-containing protein n=1 Tax=Brassica cretica TaxID=69181 RepID=A0A8S9R2G3_BRACR|nr:hypothetical protein F2Q69_00017754 [Brassica cretica]
MDRDSNDDGRILFRSLSCYQEICRLAGKDCHFSSIPRRPLFVRDVYDMVDDPSTDSVVSWSDSGKSFIIWKESEFLGDVFPRQLFGERPASPPYGYILTYSWGYYDFSRRGQNHGEVLCFPEGTQTISSVRWSCFALVVVVVFLILFYRPV